MLHLCVTTLMANGPGFGFSWVKCNMVLSDAKYTDIGVPLFFVPRIYYIYHIIYKSINRNKVRDKFGITYFEKLITMQIRSRD